VSRLVLNEEARTNFQWIRKTLSVHTYMFPIRILLNHRVLRGVSTLNIFNIHKVHIFDIKISVRTTCYCDFCMNSGIKNMWFVNVGNIDG